MQIIRDHITVSAPAWVRDPLAQSSEQGYVRTAVLSDEKDVARSSLLNETERAAAYLTRVRSLAVALDLESEVDEIIERFSAFREQAALT